MSTIGSLPKRYAKALLSLASEQQQVEKVGKDLETLAAAWTTSKELRDVFSNPLYRAELRASLVKALVQRTGASPLLDSTLRLLSDRRRMRSLPAIAEAYAILAEERAGRVRAEVVTATALPEAYFAELQATLEKVTGKKVQLARRTDPSLIAGVVARVGDRVFDGSLKNQLDELRSQLLTAPQPDRVGPAR